MALTDATQCLQTTLPLLELRNFSNATVTNVSKEFFLRDVTMYSYLLNSFLEDKSALSARCYQMGWVPGVLIVPP